MHSPLVTRDSSVKVAIMGATGTGKSTFIRHLTNDSQISIGEGIESKTSDIQTSYYPDTKTGRPIMLIDTPGFDDSRGLTDTDILQKIIDFLEPKEDQGIKLNGIIYLHRISDPRMGGNARKNLRMFQALCGQKSLRNVRIVTTYWDCAGGKGAMREEELKHAFEFLLASGAQMRRHSDTAESARKIMAELIQLSEVTTQIQEEVTRGISLGETSAGRIINEEIEALMKKHESELAHLRSTLEQSARVRNEEMRAELEAERKMLEDKIAQAEEDRFQLLLPARRSRGWRCFEWVLIHLLGVTPARIVGPELDRKERGRFWRFLHDWGSVTYRCARRAQGCFVGVVKVPGGIVVSILAAVVGAVVGFCVIGPLVAAGLAVFDR